MFPLSHGGIPKSIVSIAVFPTFLTFMTLHVYRYFHATREPPKYNAKLLRGYWFNDFYKLHCG
jgi:hypothetical protein